MPTAPQRYPHDWGTVFIHVLVEDSETKRVTNTIHTIAAKEKKQKTKQTKIKQHQWSFSLQNKPRKLNGKLHKDIKEASNFPEIKKTFVFVLILINVLYHHTFIKN